MLALAELVDLHAEGGQLEPGDLAVDRVGHRVHAGASRAGASTRCSTTRAWTAKDMSIDRGGWPSAAARFTTRPSASRFSRRPPSVVAVDQRHARARGAGGQRRAGPRG